MSTGKDKYLTVQPNTHIGTCSNCRRPVNIEAWDYHICHIDADKVDASPIQEDHNYGSVLDEHKFDIGTMPENKAHEEMIRLNQLREQQIKNFATDHFTSKLYECVASHYENGDRAGAEAIINAIQYAQQKHPF